jgi:DNA repair exonuclease SbcCD ATPase subunit
MEQGRQAATQQEKKLAETKKLTELRKEELKEKGGILKEQVEQALTKLDKTLKDMKPDLKADNAKKLNEQAQDVSDLWKKATADLPKLMENVERTAQQFGANEQAREMKEMLEKLKKGDASALNKALEETRKKLEELAKMPDGAERQKQMEQLAKELAKLSNQMKEQLGDKGANEALKRALEQMGMAKNKDAANEALQAAADSLNLTKEELERMAENFKDANNLEDALKNLAKAKQLNQDGKLDGADAANAKTMEDFAKLYQELMGDGEGQGQGDGQGKAGQKPGRGNGGTPGEDPNAITKTKDEKSKTKMGAGKLLMQWKEEGVGETGAKAQEYQEAVKAVREGVAEAIRNERIPPGYHGAIQKYFDRLPDKTK